MGLCSVKHYAFITCKMPCTYRILFFTYKEVEFHSSISVYGTAFIHREKKSPKSVSFQLLWHNSKNFHRNICFTQKQKYL